MSDRDLEAAAEGRHDILLVTVNGEEHAIGDDQEYKSSMDFLLRRLADLHGSLDKLTDEMGICPDDFIECLHDFPNEEPTTMVIDAYNGCWGDELDNDQEDRLYDQFSDR